MSNVKICAGKLLAENFVDYAGLNQPYWTGFFNKELFVAQFGHHRVVRERPTFFRVVEMVEMQGQLFAAVLQASILTHFEFFLAPSDMLILSNPLRFFQVRFDMSGVYLGTVISGSSGDTDDFSTPMYLEFYHVRVPRPSRCRVVIRSTEVFNPQI